MKLIIRSWTGSALVWWLGSWITGLFITLMIGWLGVAPLSAQAQTPEHLKYLGRYEAQNLLDEFQDVAPGSGIRPDTTRRKEELEAYSLDTLRMVGTLTMNDELWALIKASDGTIHRIKKGNYVGLNYGEIIRILDDRIELMEIVPDKPGTWREQQASLALAE